MDCCVCTLSNGAYNRPWSLPWFHHAIPTHLRRNVFRISSYLIFFRKDTIDKSSYFALSLALALFVLGVVRSFGGDDILAVFAAGIGFGWREKFEDKLKESEIEAIDLVLTTGYFIFVGTIIPFNKFSQFGIGNLIATTVLILLFRRMIPVILFYKGEGC